MALQTFNKGKYELIKEIGEGSFGRVFLCKDTITRNKYS